MWQVLKDSNSCQMVCHSSMHNTQHWSDDQLEAFSLTFVVITAVKCISSVHICNSLFIWHSWTIDNTLKAWVYPDPAPSLYRKKLNLNLLIALLTTVVAKLFYQDSNSRQRFIKKNSASFKLSLLQSPSFKVTR